MRRFQALTVAVTAVLAGVYAHADESEFTGADSADPTNYNDPLNWSTGVVPGTTTATDTSHANDDPSIGYTVSPRTAIYSSSTNLVTGGRFVVGRGGGTGTFTLTGAAGQLTYGNTNGQDYVGVDGGTGTLNVNAGTLSLNGATATAGDGTTSQVNNVLNIGQNGAGATGTVNVNGGIVNGVSTVNLGNGAATNTGVLNVSAGSLTAANDLTAESATSSANVSGTGTLTVGVFQFDHGSSLNLTGGTTVSNGPTLLYNSGSLKVSGAAGFTTGTFVDGVAGTSNASFVMSNGTMNVSGGTYVQGSNSSFAISGGNFSSPQQLDIGAIVGNSPSTTGTITTTGATALNGQTYNQTGGTVVATNQFVIGAHGSTNTATQSAGIMNSTFLYVGGYGDETSVTTSDSSTDPATVVTVLTPGTGTYTLSGTGVVNLASQLNFNGGGPNNGVFNLNGGTVNTPTVVKSGSGTATFNFNGGTLAASADNSTFMQGLTAANVQSGGAVINSNTHNITIAQPLLGTSGDGGLTKLGAGTLTLTGANTFTGPISILSGTLQANNSGLVGVSGALGDGLLQTVTIHNGSSSGALLEITSLETTTDSLVADANVTGLQIDGSAADIFTVGSLTIAGTSYAAGIYTNSNFPSFISGPGELVVTGVPEPTSLALLGLGGLGLLSRRRRA